MFDLPIPRPVNETPDVKIGRRTRHRIEILEEGPRKGKSRPALDYVSWAAAILGAAMGYFLYSYPLTQALPILLIACLVLLYLR